MRLKKRTTCRICGQSNLIDLLSLGNLAISGFCDENTEPLVAPLALCLCDPSIGGCSLVQLRHTTVSPELLYREYWYRSGMNQSMKDALRDIAIQAVTFVKLFPTDIVLDIGANDGTLLRYFPHSVIRAGFEPAINLISEAKQEGDIIINNFFNQTDFIAQFGIQAKAKIITSIAMFYDLEDPNKFVSDITKILHPKGIWINQLSYLPLMLSRNAFDNICHEHIEYYSLTSIIYLLQQHNLEICDVELNDVNGGSFRLYIKHQNASINLPSGSDQRISTLLKKESGQQLTNRNIYYTFAKRVKRIRRTVRKIVRNIIKKGGSVYVYGASTKGNTLLQYFGLDHTLITAAAERNPAKWGKKTIATNIPIVSENAARSANPTHFLVLPWHFKKEFIAREREYLLSGGKMIFPLPKFEVITKDDLLNDS